MNCDLNINLSKSVKGIFALLSVMIMISCGSDRESAVVMETIRIVEEYYPVSNEEMQDEAEEQSPAKASSGSAYICTGKGAGTYHTTRQCPGLGQCKESIKLVTLNKARSMGRRECKRCHPHSK